MNTDVQNIFNQLLNQFDDEFFWYDDRNENGGELFYTDNVANVTGYTKNELLSMPGNGRAIIFDEDLNELKLQMEEFKKETDKNRMKIEFRIVKKDKNLVWVRETIIVERNEQGNIVKYFGKINDITAFKEREKSLGSDVEELKKINSSKDNFIAMLSHDLRAPFTSILGFSEILLNETNLSDKEKAEYLSYINDSSQNQLHLINDLLDWSRLQTGRLKIEPFRVHAQSTVFNCVSSLTGNAIRKNIDIKVDVPDTLHIEVDERLITLVLTNLLSNAIKFSPEKSTVEISANIYNEKFSEFIIKDNGIGISEERKEKLFKIGKVFSTEGTKGEKGTGLGLALTKEIIEKHKGMIWYYSSPGEGSEFHFTVPSSANSILIVKNDKEKKETFIKLLKERYPLYQIIAAENGYEALGVIISQMPSLIITDHEMPLMNGLQLVQSIRREDKNLNIPVIALLNEESEEVKKAYQKYGIKTVQEGPIIIDELDDKLRSILI